MSLFANSLVDIRQASLQKHTYIHRCRLWVAHADGVGGVSGIHTRRPGHSKCGQPGGGEGSEVGESGCCVTRDCLERTGRARLGGVGGERNRERVIMGICDKILQ